VIGGTIDTLHSMDISSFVSLASVLMPRYHQMPWVNLPVELPCRLKPRRKRAQSISTEEADLPCGQYYVRRGIHTVLYAHVNIMILFCVVLR